MNPTLTITALAAAAVFTEKGRTYVKAAVKEVIKLGYVVKEEATELMAEAKEQIQEMNEDAKKEAQKTNAV